MAFYEAKVGPDGIKPTQLRFLETALRVRRLTEFMIVEVAGPAPRETPRRQPGDTAGWDKRLAVSGPHAGGQELLRLAGQDLLRALSSVAGPDEPQARQVLREVAAAIEARLREPGS